jgi:translation initiation factor 2B subunit (eIF-2B alpha/beta/delta family)
VCGAQMDHIEFVRVFEVIVFGLAIAQMLLILLTLYRERDVRDLRDQIEEQHLRLMEMRAWLAGLRASQSKQLAPENKPESGASAYDAASEELRPSSTAQAAKTREWEQDVATRLQASIKTQQTETSSVNGFKWFKDDPNEPPGIAEARQIVRKTNQSQSEKPPVDPATRRRTSAIGYSFVEVERTLTAIKSLKDDPDNLAGLNGKPTTFLKR